MQVRRPACAQLQPRAAGSDPTPHQPLLPAAACDGLRPRRDPQADLRVAAPQQRAPTLVDRLPGPQQAGPKRAAIGVPAVLPKLHCPEGIPVVRWSLRRRPAPSEPQQAPARDARHPGQRGAKAAQSQEQQPRGEGGRDRHRHPARQGEAHAAGDRRRDQRRRGTVLHAAPRRRDRASSRTGPWGLGGRSEPLECPATVRRLSGSRTPTGRCPDSRRSCRKPPLMRRTEPDPARQAMRRSMPAAARMKRSSSRSARVMGWPTSQPPGKPRVTESPSTARITSG